MKALVLIPLLFLLLSCVGEQNMAGSATNFPLTRAEMAEILVEAFDIELVRPVKPFSDVPVTHPYYSDIALLASSGITAGCGGDRFCPNDPVTRAQMAVFISRAFGVTSGKATFTDTVGHWAAQNIAAVADAGIMVGCGSGRFCPDDLLPQWQADIIVSRLSSHGEILDGTFFYLDYRIDAGEIASALDELQKLKMDIVIVLETKENSENCEAKYEWTQGLPDKIGTLLDEAEVRDMKVYLGLVRVNYDSNCPFWVGGLSMTAIEETEKTVSYILSHYNSPALAGWYIPNEPFIHSWNDPSLTHSHYRKLVSAIKGQSELPVIIAPSLITNEPRSAAVVAQRAKAFQDATGVDIQCWQDNSDTPAATTRKGQSNSLDGYFTAIRNAIGKHAFCIDVEFYSRQREKLSGLSYAVPTRQVEQVIAAANDRAPLMVSWSQQYYMSDIFRNRRYGSERLKAGYLASIGERGKLLTPSYFWSTEPSSNRPDSGNELTDGVLARYYETSDPAWTAILGDAKVTFSFSKPTTVDWISFHVLDFPAASINYPLSLTLECMDDDHWFPLGTWKGMQPSSDVLATIGNDAALEATCSQLRATLTNSQWTFLSEVEIIGR